MSETTLLRDQSAVESFIEGLDADQICTLVSMIGGKVDRLEISKVSKSARYTNPEIDLIGKITEAYTAALDNGDGEDAGVIAAIIDGLDQDETQLLVTLVGENLNPVELDGGPEDPNASPLWDNDEIDVIKEFRDFVSENATGNPDEYADDDEDEGGAQ